MICQFNKKSILYPRACQGILTLISVYEIIYLTLEVEQEIKKREDKKAVNQKN